MYNQTEAEIERHVLTQTKALSDGSRDRIFTRNQRNEVGVYTYNCHLCGVATLPERALQTHITGKKHQHKLMVDYIPDAAQFRAPLMPKVKPIQMVYTGEPLPPGQEEEYNVVSQLEMQCNKQKKATLGLEYIIESIDNKLKEPFYICSLCDKRCDPRNIIPQITSHRHRLKYLELHFPDVYKKLQQHKRFNDDMTYREEILSNISDKIEKKFGRKKPFICEYTEYEKNKAEIHHQLTLKDHFTQDEWPESTKVLLETLSENDGYDSLSSDDDGAFVDDRSFHIAKRASGITRRPMFSTKIPEKPGAKKDYIQEMRKFLTPRELQEESNRKMEEKYTLEKYKTMVEIAVNELEKELKQHEKNPEKHPKYSEEWKSFWSRRYKQLTLQGKNANDHDYKPEWISYWMERMKELHKKEVEKVKADKAKKLGLLPDQVKNVEFKFKRGSRSRSNSRSRSPLSLRHRKRSESPIKISDDSDDEDRRRASKRARRNNDRPSRFDDSSAYKRQSEHRSREAYEGYYSTRRRSKSSELIDEGPVSLISVCRFLSALESELGLLAHKVLDLLTESVRVEKLKPNSADDLLFDIKNSTMLETVGQKLKGMLNANILEPSKVTPVKRAIQNIATLLHDVAKRKPSGSSKPEPMFEEESALSPDEAARIEIAKLITANLIEQGLENVGADVIEEMIDSFMNANKASEPEVKEVKKPEPMPVKPEPQPSTSKAVQVTKNKESSGSSSGLENLSDDELQILLRNFADLTSDEQSHLIAYLSKIEKVDPERVERLKKFVDLGDGEPAVENIDIDQEVRSPLRKKSPPHVPKADLSDDDYDDDKLVRKMGATSVSSESVKPKSNANALQDKSGLANDLMSSLMQSSNPPPQSWPMAQSSEMMQQSYYSSSDMPQYMTGAGMYGGYQQQMPEMQMPMAFNQSAQWPQSAASNFFQEQIPNEFSVQNQNNQDAQFRNRFDGSSNNRQLTGKKNKNRR